MMSLQCLGQVEGWTAGSEREALGRIKAEHWLMLCKHLGLEFCQASLGLHFSQSLLVEADIIGRS
jgi:hypothetical protein